MPLLTGALGGRRYRVIGDFNPEIRETYLDRLREEAFREPRSAAKGGENLGWVTLHNLCDTEFSGESCFFTQYFCFSLRIDNKRLPAKLVKALLELRMRDWLAESGREKVPTVVKKEMREQLELELFPRQLPSVAVHDVCWDLTRGTAHFFSNSGRANEVFRTLFAKSFQLETRPIGPLQLIAEHGQADTWVPALDRIGYADYRPEAPR